MSFNLLQLLLLCPDCPIIVSVGPSTPSVLLKMLCFQNNFIHLSGINFQLAQSQPPTGTCGSRFPHALHLIRGHCGPPNVSGSWSSFSLASAGDTVFTMFSRVNLRRSDPSCPRTSSVVPWIWPLGNAQGADTAPVRAEGPGLAHLHPCRAW